MKKLCFYFIVLLAAVWVGLKIAADPGYLLVAYQKVTVEMPLWLAVIGILFLFITLYYLIRIISNIRSMGARIRAWSRTRRLRRAWMRTQRGLMSLAACEWKQAEKDLIRAATRTETPLLNYLFAAQAAQEQGTISQRDEYLGKIQTKGKIEELARGLTQARLQLRCKQYEQALATLQPLQHIAPKHPAVLKFLKHVYIALEDWHALEILLTQLEKYAILKEEQLEALQLKTGAGLLITAGENISLVWSRLPKKLRQHPTLLNIYIPLLAKKASDEAEALLRTALQKNSDDRLFIQYGLIKSIHQEKQLQLAESFLKSEPKNAALLLTLGRLCINNQLWGKARSYLEASIGVKPTPEAFQALGSLLEQLGETAQALDCYRSGLSYQCQTCSAE